MDYEHKQCAYVCAQSLNRLSKKYFTMILLRNKRAWVLRIFIIIFLLNEKRGFIRT